MHHPTDRITHTTAFVTPVVEHWLERKIAQWVHPMKDRSDDPSHHERTLYLWTVTDSSDFPLKFCRHRWLVNGPVSSRAMNIWESLKTYVAAVTAVDRKKKVARPANNSYSVISQAVKDPLIISKFAFMNSVSKEVEPFLQLYQTDKPMVPFIATDLGLPSEKL